MSPTLEEVKEYFSHRTPKYDRSSSWVSDFALGKRMCQVLGIQAGQRVLDVASGTGFLGKVFKASGAELTGLDYTTAMMKASRPHYADLVIGDAHQMPFPDASFDAAVSRQGIQFMDAPRAVAEMARVVRPGGKVLLGHLTAYGGGDEQETFEIQRLRNPVRRKFFLPDDQPELLRGAGLEVVQVERYVTLESAKNWLNCGSISAERQTRALEIYRDASSHFRELHHLEVLDGDYLDRMLFILALGEKK